jgi:hypothetical protein
MRVRGVWRGLCAFSRETIPPCATLHYFVRLLVLACSLAGCLVASLLLSHATARSVRCMGCAHAALLGAVRVIDRLLTRHAAHPRFDMIGLSGAVLFSALRVFGSTSEEGPLVMFSIDCGSCP